MSRYRKNGVAIAVIALAAIYALQPGPRHFVWPAIAWSIFIMSAIVAVAVVCNILVVLYHMFFGYIPVEERLLKQASTDMQTKMPNFEPRVQAGKPGRVA
jgi:TctA family transporter